MTLSNFGGRDLNFKVTRGHGLEILACRQDSKKSIRSRIIILPHIGHLGSAITLLTFRGHNLNLKGHQGSLSFEILALRL